MGGDTCREQEQEQGDDNDICHCSLGSLMMGVGGGQMCRQRDNDDNACLSSFPRVC
jgi:hypothetical protein